MLRKTWMNHLSHGVAFLESLNLARGDLRPENILLDRNCLRLSDFDCTAKIGSEFEACIAPYGRVLGSEGGQDQGTAGLLGPRTEQFALGSLYYIGTSVLFSASCIFHASKVNPVTILQYCMFTHTRNGYAILSANNRTCVCGLDDFISQDIEFVPSIRWVRRATVSRYHGGSIASGDFV